MATYIRELIVAPSPAGDERAADESPAVEALARDAKVAVAPGYLLQPVSYSAESLADAALHEAGDGVYTVFASADAARVVSFQHHLDRLKASASGAGISIRCSWDDLESAIRSSLRLMFRDSGLGTPRVRLTLPASGDRVTISFEPFVPLPQQVRESGVRCASVSNAVRSNPATKRSQWIKTRSKLRKGVGSDIYELLLTDGRGSILEGSSSNFYAVTAGPLLRTASEGVLPGISREIVLAVAPRLLPVKLDPVSIGELDGVTEAFITSSSRGVVPVVAIDDKRIGGGTPGPITNALRELYDEFAESMLETV